MREIRLSGSVEGVVSDHDSYSDLGIWPKYSCVVQSSSGARVHRVAAFFPRFQAALQRADSADTLPS